MLPAAFQAIMAPSFLVPLLMALLCGVGLLQQQHSSLRLLLAASLSATVALPFVAAEPGLTPLVPIAFYLLGTACSWQAIAGIAGRRPHVAWLAAPPLIWLASCTTPWCRSGTGRLLAAMAIDHVLILLCLMALVGTSRSITGRRTLIVTALLHPFVVFAFLVSVLVPASPAWGRMIAAMLMAETLARVVLWPGLGLIMVLEMATLRDELSGVLNRRGFWRAAERLDNRTILLFDIDHFKRINDTFGHATGDTVIRRFTTLAGSVLGANTIFGRIGGEEFAAALTEMTPMHARRVAERLRTAFEQVEGPDSATVSVGISLPNEASLSLNDQMALADRALYRAKRLGRNRTVVHVDDCAKMVGMPEAGATRTRRSLRDL